MMTMGELVHGSNVILFKTGIGTNLDERDMR